MKSYLDIFIDEEYPNFLDKYLKTKTMKRIMGVSQFCGCDYTKLYNPLFFLTRFDHSLVVAHMVWHFTHDKKATIAALLHDVGTPCFAHTIDVLMDDAISQESSEKDILEIIKKDAELMEYLMNDKILLADLANLDKYSILENKSPKLCADRLDGVLHTCYVWLHTHTLEEIQEVYSDLIVLKNEEGNLEIGFSHKKVALKFVKMVYVYAKELQGNRDKYVMKYISETIKKAIQSKFLKIADLYVRKEKDIIKVLSESFCSWNDFSSATDIVGTNQKPTNFSVSFEIKKRNVIPLIKEKNDIKRIDDVSKSASIIYKRLQDYHDFKYGYITKIKNIV